MRSWRVCVDKDGRVMQITEASRHQREVYFAPPFYKHNSGTPKGTRWVHYVYAPDELSAWVKANNARENHNETMAR